MALIILLFLHLILEVHPQYPPQPHLSVHPAVITQNGSVHLHCGAVYDKSQCYYYPKGQDTKTKLSSTCQLSLTGSELMWWTGRRSGSPQPVNIVCFYTTPSEGSKPSYHSLPATVVILDQKPTLSVHNDHQIDEFTAVCEIDLSGSVSAEFRCQLYTGDQLFLRGESWKSDSGKLNCFFTASKNALFSHLHLTRSRELSCDYSLNSDPSTRSPTSDKYDPSVWFPELTHPSTTQQKSTTAPPLSSTHLFTSKDPTTSVAPNTSSATKEPDPASVSTQVTQRNPTDPTSNSTVPIVPTVTTVPIVPTVTTVTTVPTVPTVTSAIHTPTRLSSTVSIPDSTKTGERVFSTTGKSPKTGPLLITAVSVTASSVLLGGVMIIVLCRFIKKQQSRTRFKLNSKTGDQVCMTAMVSVQESGEEASGTYSVISPAFPASQPLGNTTPIKNCDDTGPQAETEITAIAAPPEPSGSSKAKESSGCSESDVYHMYSTIPDLHVTPIQNDAVYSLLQKH